ncbi:MAG: hypothetical protein LBV16_05115 [Elusimicrobiota bacterium]|jgi:hypothetical protein|nr:hypothetical protein [Elusimicrobiota bacterium]
MNQFFTILKLIPKIASFLPEIARLADNTITIERLKRRNKALKTQLLTVSILAFLFLAAFIVFLVLYLQK